MSLLQKGQRHYPRKVANAYAPPGSLFGGVPPANQNNTLNNIPFGSQIYQQQQQQQPMIQQQPAAFHGATQQSYDLSLVQAKKSIPPPVGMGRSRGGGDLPDEDFIAAADEIGVEGGIDLFGNAIVSDRLAFEEATLEDYGLTTTYDVPGARTISPSSLTRRHKVASLHVPTIQLSHVAVPKLRSAAFLRVSLRNPSSTITLLPGSAGITLDGSFLGTIQLPRVAPSSSFKVPLGVDPSVHVSYPNPIVRRSTVGVFSKETAAAFGRAIWLTNTKSGPAEIKVIDQIPVSEDEKLKIEVAVPKGLNVEGDSVRAGIAAPKDGNSDGTAPAASPSSSQQTKAWGRATASLKKGGRIEWDVELHKGQACLLKLEYDVRLPSNESIVAV